MAFSCNQVLQLYNGWIFTETFLRQFFFVSGREPDLHVQPRRLHDRVRRGRAGLPRSSRDHPQLPEELRHRSGAGRHSGGQQDRFGQVEGRQWKW